MTPLDFITDYEQYNDPVGRYKEALTKPILIRSMFSEWEVLSYYLDSDGQMVLDIGEKELLK